MVFLAKFSAVYDFMYIIHVMNDKRVVDSTFLNVVGGKLKPLKQGKKESKEFDDVSLSKVPVVQN